MYPVSPFDGTIEKIHVKIGQVVNPGTILATITSTDVTTTATALVPQAVAQNVHVENYKADGKRGEHQLIVV